MTIESSQNNPAITETAVNQAAEAVIRDNCNKHGISREQFPADGVEEARRIVRHEMEVEAARKSNPMFAENELLRQKLGIAEAQLFASKNARTSASSATSANTQPSVTVEIARAKLGEYEWNHVLTPDTRLMAIGVQPGEVTAAVRQEITEVFGPQSTSARASEMFRADPARYRRLREIGRCLRII